jgi:hypothetical protein
MKTALRIAAALTALAFATPVLACGDQKPTTASAEKDSSKQQQAGAEKTKDKAAVKTATAAR